MTANENRGGARAPDGVQRVAPIAGAPGGNRTDLAELPGTPGTPLPPSPTDPSVSHGEVGRLRQQLGNVPIEQVSPSVGLKEGTQRPDEPITSGIDSGAGPGASSLLPSSGQLTQQLTAEEMRVAYPLIMRLATLPNATTETKILAQRIRANLPIAPEQMPDLRPPDGPTRTNQ